MSILSFRNELEHLINQYSLENGSNTPDGILADYLTDCLQAFDRAVMSREKWYGRPDSKLIVLSAPTTGESDQPQIVVPTSEGVDQVKAEDQSASGEESHILRLVTHDEEGRFIAPTLVLDQEDSRSNLVAAIPDPAISENAVEQVLTELQADEIEGWHDEESEKEQASDKQKSAQWARDLLKSEFVIFDTETTGFEADDEIIQIGIVDQTGATVLERLIKPTKPVLNSMYHGITDDMLKDAPGFPEVYEQIKRALEGKTVVAYNLDYDRRMLFQDCRRHTLDPLAFTGRCAMEQYGAFNGEWNDYHGNYRWKKLREALAAFGLKHEDFGTKAHDAGTDARATLAVIRKMAEFEADKAVAAK